MIPEVNPYNNYRGDGVATLFDYDFFIQNGSQLIVEHIDENDVVTRLEENIDYEIVVIEEEFAGYIKFPIEDSKFGILQENETLSLQLTLPFEQISEYGQSSLLDLNSIEFSLDYLTRLCQILKRQMERSVRVNEGSEATPEQLLETINNNAIVSTNAATIASKKADEAMESANVASGKVEEINNIYTEAVEKIETDKSNAIEEIEQSSSEGVEELNKIKEETKAFKDELVESGMYKFNLFDAKISDHILKGNEAKGWALQGTYVYKEAIAGSRYGYPDFYNKCLEEYQSGETEYFPIRGELWEQPILSENGTLGGDTFAVETDSVYSDDGENYEPYRMFDGDASTSWQSNGTTSSATYFTFYNPKPINVTQITWSGTPIYGTITAGVVYGSNDNSEWVQIGTFSGGTTTGGTMDLSANKEFYKYHKIIPTSWTDSSSTYTNGWAELTITAYHPAIKINSNGHRFYDIAHKDAVDEYYNANGAAWFYGIDTENERIFLPRNDWFFQSGNAENVGQFNEAGLPNITGQFPISCNFGTPTGPFRHGSTFSGNGSSANGCRYITYDQSRVNTIYGNSDTVQPKSVNLLLYIVVGNTNVESSITDVVDVTTTENDTTPLFTAQYFDFKPNNASWLKAGEQTNGAGIYKFCFSELVNELSTPKYGLKVIETANMIAGVDYSLYWQVDQVNMTFKTPTAIATKSLSGAVCGNGMTVGWTNGSEFAGTVLDGTGGSGNTGAVRLSPGSYGRAVGAGSAGGIAGLGECYGITTDPSNSGIIAEQSSAQLYFKVANAVEKLELLDAGKVMEEAVLKSNLVEAQVVIRTYQSGASGYRIWSDGYCEQWGYVAYGSGTSGTIVFLKKFKDTNYIVVNNLGNTAANNYFAIDTNTKTTSSVPWYKSNTALGGDWLARGYLAKGEY